MIHYSATYSPEDNKIRLTASARLDAETYARVRAAGYAWAPKQEIFVAPAWTPRREDLALELAGQIDDEDTSLVERAEERAERFEGYSERREAEAEQARERVESIAGGIPLGQPILVGHHSERRARRDAEKIQAGMARAVNLWKTAKYWTDRAAGALAHAKYKELPGVRARRIKGLEADLRKCEKEKAEAQTWASRWATEGLTLEKARTFANYCRLTCCKHPTLDQSLSAYDVLRDAADKPADYPTWTVAQVQARAAEAYAASVAYADRWIEHLQNRLAYERAMLEEGGGLAGAKFDYMPGGKVLSRGQWFTVVKVNRRGGVVGSVTVVGHWATTIPVDRIADYTPPADDETAAKARQVVDKGPLCNYPAEGHHPMTKAEWEALPKWSDEPKTKVFAQTEKHGKHRMRVVRASRVRQVPGESRWSMVPVYLTDAKTVEPPAPEPDAPKRGDFAPERDAADRPRPKPEPSEQAAAFEALEQTARAGVQVVTAPSLFPTPPELAARVAEAADIRQGLSVLEPSAGTGNLVRAALDKGASVMVAVEVSHGVAESLRGRFVADSVSIQCRDFLSMEPETPPQFDRVVMNPPFENAADIKHVQHAIRFLKPGGRLVAIVAAGPRQRAAFADDPDCVWEDLPEGSFVQSGTNVRTALVTFDKP